MKKKILALLVAFAVCGTCVAGLSACNNGGNGEAAVDEAGWKAAYEKTTLATNFTYTLKETFDINGYVGESFYTAYRFDNQYFEDVTDVYTYEGEDYTDRICYYAQYENDKTYGVRGFGSVWIEETSYSYSAERFLENYACLGPIFDGNKSFGDLYSEFTYADGKYTATLNDGKQQIPYIVKLNAEGYISYISCEYEMENAGKSAYEFNFYNFGTTSYEVPAAAKKAIDDNKAKNN